MSSLHLCCICATPNFRGFDFCKRAVSTATAKYIVEGGGLFLAVDISCHAILNCFILHVLSKNLSNFKVLVVPFYSICYSHLNLQCVGRYKVPVFKVLVFFGRRFLIPVKFLYY